MYVGLKLYVSSRYRECYCYSSTLLYCIINTLVSPWHLESGFLRQRWDHVGSKYQWSKTAGCLENLKDIFLFFVISFFLSETRHCRNFLMDWRLSSDIKYVLQWTGLSPISIGHAHQEPHNSWESGVCRRRESCHVVLVSNFCERQRIG